MSSLGELPNFRKVHTHRFEVLVFDDNCMIIFVFNGRTAGNFKLAHTSSMEDGLLDVILVKATT